MMRTGPRTGALVLAAALWGAAISGTKVALRGFGPLTLLDVELAAAALALWLAVALRGRRPLLPWRYATALGLLEPFLAYLCETVGLQRTSAANASMIGGLEAAFVILLAAMFLGERITPVLRWAVLFGLGGLLVLERAGRLTGPGFGDALVLAGAFCAAVYTIVARRLESPGTDGRNLDCLMLTAQQFLVAALALALCSLAAWTGGYQQVSTPPARYWVAAVLVGVLGFGASFVLYNWAIVLVDARSSAVILNMIPVFGLVCAIAWLGEPLSSARLIGAALITASVGVFGWTELRPAREPERPAVIPEELSCPRP